jgi:hypothetical protein
MSKRIVEAGKKPATMGGGTAHGTLSPQWAPLQTGAKQQSHW